MGILRARRFHFKLTPPLLWLIGILALVMLLFFIHRQGRPQRLASKAKTYLQQNDHDGAMLTAQRALQLDPFNITAMRVMAQLQHRQRLETSLQWWEKVVEDTRSASDALAWATAALDFGDTAAAQRALEMVQPAERTSADFKGTAGIVAFENGKVEQAQALLHEALQLSPNNSRYRLYFAQALLKNPRTQEKARKIFEELAADPVVGVAARRALINEATARRDFSAALAHSESVAERPNASFDDKLLHLELLRKSASPEFRNELIQVQKEAQGKEQVHELLLWMVQNDMAADAIRWSGSFSEQLKNDPQNARALAEARVATGDWHTLRQTTGDEDWGWIDALRLAYYAHAQRQLGDEVGFRASWNAAKIAAIKDSGITAALAEIIEDWKWGQELRELWWEAAQHSSQLDWALSNLSDLYQEEGDTAGLLRVSERMLQRGPADRVAKNNLAMCYLLLNQEIQKALELSREVAREDPRNALFVSTYAFALYSSGDSERALELMNSLEKQQLREPEIALYYGLILAKNNQQERARQFLSLAKKAELLPEEKELLTQAEQFTIPESVEN